VIDKDKADYETLCVFQNAANATESLNSSLNP
jgi:hypothetical protein